MVDTIIVGIPLFIIISIMMFVGLTATSSIYEVDDFLILTDVGTEVACIYNPNATGLNAMNTTSKGSLVWVSSDFSFDGTDGIGLDNSNEMHYLNVDHESLIRQKGTVKGVTVETDTGFNSTSLTGFYVSVWRLDNSTYDRIGQTPNLITDLKAASGSGETVQIILNSIDYITGVIEGDYVGYSFEGTGLPTLEAINAQGETTGISTYYFNGTTPPASNADWESESSLNDWADVRLLMDSPSILFLGQSITAGSINHVPYIKSSPDWNMPETTISWFVGDKLGVSTQNFGNAGSCSACTVQNGVSVMNTHVVPMNPKILMIAYGNNDVAFGTPVETFKTRLTSIVDTAQANGITPVVQGIYVGHRDDADTEAMEQAIRDVAAAEGINMIDPTPALAQRVSETSCLLTNYKIGYNNVSHLTPLGHNVTADFLINPIDPNYTEIVIVQESSRNTEPDNSIVGAFGILGVSLVAIAAVVIMRITSSMR